MEQNLLKLDGRMVVVTGAAGGGIGTSVTRRLAEVGATVVAVSRSQEKLDKNIAPLIARGLSIVPLVADVSTDEGVAATMEQVRRTKATLYGLVNASTSNGPILAPTTPPCFSRTSLSVQRSNAEPIE